jgi:hypothetical protein
MSNIKPTIPTLPPSAAAPPMPPAPTPPAPQNGETSTAPAAGSPFIPTAPTPPPSVPSIPTALATGVPTPSVSTAAPVPVVPPATPNSFTTLFGASSPSSVLPPAPTPSTGTGGTSGWQAPEGVLPGQVTAGVPLEEANRRGLKGSEMFGSPPKSNTTELEAVGGQGQGAAQTAPTPVTPPAAQTPAPGSRGVQASFPPKVIEKMLAGPGSGRRSTTPTPTPPAQSATSSSTGSSSSTSGPTSAPSNTSASIPTETGPSKTPEYDGTLAGIVEFDPALMDMAIADTEEAQLYLSFLGDPPDGSPGIPWKQMTDKQKYTQRVCLEMLLREAEARLAQIGLIVVGAAPIGLSITFNETLPPNAGPEQEVNAAIEAGHAAVVDSAMKVIGSVPSAVETAVTGPATAVPGITEKESAEANRALAQFDTPNPFEGVSHATLEVLLAPDTALEVEGFDEEVDEGDEILADDEYEGSKTEAAGLMARTAAEEPRHKGPKTSTGVPLTEEGIRPYVEAYAAHVLKKNAAGQGDIEHKLGLEIGKAGQWKSYKSEDQQGVRERIVNDAIANLVKQGQPKGEGGKSSQKGAAPDQMARMKMKCSNAAVGCDSPRHSHRNASGQCYEPRCPCKGRCETFVEPGGPTGGKGTDDAGATTGAVSSGVPAAPTPPQGGGFEGQHLFDEAANIEWVMAGGAWAIAYQGETVKNRLAALKMALGAFMCEDCFAAASVHPGGTGVNPGAPTTCKGFRPRNEEQARSWATLLVKYGLMSERKGMAYGVPPKREGGSVPGPDGLGEGNVSAGPAGNQVHGDGGTRPGGGVGDGLGATSEVAVAGRVGGVPAGLVEAAAEPGVAPARPATIPGLPPPLPPRDSGPADPYGASLHTAGDGQARPGDGQAAPAPSQANGDAGVSETEAGPADEMTIQEVVDGIAWAGGYVYEGKVYVPADTAELDWWPIQIELDAHEHTVARREEAVARMVAWWNKAVFVKPPTGPRFDDGVINPALNLRSTSYRVVLAAKELSAQIERYARAWRTADGGPIGVPAGSVPDDIQAGLLEKIRESAIAYFEAHKVTPEGEPDTDFVTYMEACVMWEIEVGTPWADIQRMLAERAPVAAPQPEPQDETVF